MQICDFSISSTANNFFVFYTQMSETKGNVVCLKNHTSFLCTALHKNISNYMGKLKQKKREVRLSDKQQRLQL